MDKFNPLCFFPSFGGGFLTYIYIVLNDVLVHILVLVYSV